VKRTRRVAGLSRRGVTRLWARVGRGERLELFVGRGNAGIEVAFKAYSEEVERR
jgi:hypothetical protein